MPSHNPRDPPKEDTRDETEGPTNSVLNSVTVGLGIMSMKLAPVLEMINEIIMVCTFTLKSVCR